MSSPASVSVVILTRDEGTNIAECLDAVLPQLRERDEVVLVDSGSSDGTVAVGERHAIAHPGRVRMHAFPTKVSLGEARNAGVSMARHDVIVFVSADATPEAGWLDALRRAIDNADIAYGRQRHAPPQADAITVSRGLRYHHFERRGDTLPETFASTANAAFRRFCFGTIVLDDDLPGSDDLVFARRARLAGLRIAYAKDAVVRHKDVASWRGEWRKHLREGAAHAKLASLLGIPKLHLAWAMLVAVLGIAAVALQSAILLALCLLAFFTPTIRRVLSPAARHYKAPQLAAAAAVSPLFDLAFVGSYLTQRARRH